MASQALEQILEFAPSLGQTRTHQTIDTYTSGTTKLYSFDPPKPLGTFSGLKPSGFGVLKHDIGYGLQERYDFSGHNNTTPHLNYDLLNAKKYFSINALRDAHHIDLFKK